LFLQSAVPREVVARMLRNLKEIHRNVQAWPRLLPVMQRLVVLLPQAWEERRDRGLLYAELGLFDAAARDLRTYLDQVDDAPDREMVAQRLAALPHP
jgi:regulator of sirC expression with transglutaminase-like and TPR domain